MDQNEHQTKGLVL